MAISNFLTNVKQLWVGSFETYNDVIIPTLINGNLPFDSEKSDKISTIYTCIKILADTISRMPLNIYEDAGNGKIVKKNDYRYPILHYQPNNWTTQQTFFAALEYWRNLKGNSFARIYRNNGKVRSLVLLSPSKVKDYKIVNDQLYYLIEDDEGKIEPINSSEILHFKCITKDGIWGLNPIEALRQNLSITYQGFQTIDNFYRNNAMTPKIIKSTVPNTKQDAMIKALDEFNAKYAGAAKAGNAAILPPNTDIVDLKLNLADVEFINTIKFNAQQIAALYGVPPHMVGILEATKYNNVEYMMLEFKASTLASIGRMYRQELESKLLTTEERLNGVSIEFNFNALMETDSKTRVENLRTLQGMGVVTPNDVCKLEGYPTYPEGDEHFMPGNYLTVSKITNLNNTDKTFNK